MLQPNTSNNTTSTTNTNTSDQYPVNILTLEPSSDHSLAYLVLEEGVSIFGCAVFIIMFIMYIYVNSKY